MRYKTVFADSIPKKMEPYIPMGYTTYAEYNTPCDIPYPLLVLLSRCGFDGHRLFIMGYLHFDNIDEVIKVIKENSGHHYDDMKRQLSHFGDTDLLDIILNDGDVRAECNRLWRKSYNNFHHTEEEIEHYKKLLSGEDVNHVAFSKRLITNTNLLDTVMKHRDKVMVVSCSKLTTNIERGIGGILGGVKLYDSTHESVGVINRVRLLFKSSGDARAFMKDFNRGNPLWDTTTISIRVVNRVVGEMNDNIHHKTYGLFISKRTSPIRNGDIAYLAVKSGYVENSIPNVCTCYGNGNAKSVANVLTQEINEYVSGIYSEIKKLSERFNVSEPLIQTDTLRRRKGHAGFNAVDTSHHLSKGYCPIQKSSFRHDPECVLTPKWTFVNLQYSPCEKCDSVPQSSRFDTVRLGYTISIPIPVDIDYGAYAKYFNAMKLIGKLKVDEMSLMVLPHCYADDGVKDNLLKLLDSL